jgi:ATP-binding protein involved in chromosome partitioning
METAINKALRKIIEPVSGLDFIESGLITNISLKNEQLRIIIEKPSGHNSDLNIEREKITNELTKINGIESVSFLITAHSNRQEASVTNPSHERKPPNFSSIRPPNIDKIIAVASGKGGVGKSTIAYNLALALARAGKRVGILDADIYGPSLPTLMGQTDLKCDVDGNNKIIPATAHGICAMSMGFIIGKDQPLAWRGPMVTKALTQLFQGVNWGELDFLILDMPPGTGDVQLSLAQQARIDGVIMVSTPQEVALADVRRGATMFQKSGVEIIGMVENMSLLIDENTGAELDIFGRGGAKAAAEQIDIPFLGEVNFYPSLRQASDTGNSTPRIAIASFDKLASTITN